MNMISVGIGAVAICFGLSTLIIRVKRPQAFPKLASMKQSLGETRGTIMHVVAYSVLPIIFGVIAVLAGMSGIAIF